MIARRTSATADTEMAITLTGTVGYGLELSDTIMFGEGDADVDVDMVG